MARRLTPEEIDEMIALTLEGVTDVVIARKIGVHPSTVSRTMRKLKVRGKVEVRSQAEIDKVVRHYATGVTITEVAKRIGVTRSTAAGILHRAGALGKRTLGGGATISLQNRMAQRFGVPSKFIVLAPPLPVLTSVPEPVSQSVPITEATGCRWIDDQGKCCNHTQHNRSSYCQHHLEKSQKCNEQAEDRSNVQANRRGRPSKRVRNRHSNKRANR